MRSRMRTAVIVLRRIVGRQKRAAIEEQAATPITSADKTKCVGGVSVLGARLRKILRATFHVSQRIVGRDRQIGRLESPASFVRTAAPCFVNPRLGTLEQRSVHQRNAVQVVPRHAVVAGVVVATDEVRFFGNHESAIGKHLSHARIIGHLREGSGVRTAATAAAGTTVMCRFVRIVQTGRTVTANHDQT